MADYRCVCGGYDTCYCKKGDSIPPVSKTTTTKTITTPPKSIRPFDVLTPRSKELAAVRLSPDNYAEVGYYILREGHGGVEFPADRQSLTWITRDGKRYRFDMDDWIVTEWDYAMMLGMSFRHATEDEAVAYVLKGWRNA